MSKENIVLMDMRKRLQFSMSNQDWYYRQIKENEMIIIALKECIAEMESQTHAKDGSF